MTTIEELRNYAKGCFRGESQKASQLMTKAATELEILTKERDDFCKANERNVRELQSQLTTAHLDNERLTSLLKSWVVFGREQGLPGVSYNLVINTEKALTTSTPNPIEQELKELRRDKERLDWLQNQKWADAIRVHCQVGNDLRLAIDSASKERTTT